MSFPLSSASKLIIQIMSDHQVVKSNSKCFYDATFNFSNGYTIKNPLQFNFDLCNLPFTGVLSVTGNSARNRKVALQLTCPNQRHWKVVCICEIAGNNDINEWIFNHDTKKNDTIISTKGDLVEVRCTIFLVDVGRKKFPVKENNFFKQTCWQLFEGKKFCDILFKVGDKEIQAHKNILACSSPVFEAMFVHKMKESLSNEIIIEDMEPDVFEEMLRFIYCGEVLDLDEVATKLLPASEKYDLPILKSKCEKHLADNIAIENAAEILILADLHRADELKKYVLSFIKSNKNEVAQTQEWNELLNTHSQFLPEIIMKLMKDC